MEVELFLARVVHYAATMVLLGALCFDIFVALPVRRVEAEAESNRTGANSFDRLGRLRRLIEWTGLGLAVASAVAWLVCVSADILDVSIAEAFSPAILWPVLSTTQFGRTWIARLALGALLAVCLAYRRSGSPDGPRPADWLALGLGVMFVASLAFAGHAAATPGMVGAALLISDMVHLVAASAWVGGLVPLAALFAFALRHGDNSSTGTAASATRRFSILGITAVTAIVTTGVINSWILVGSLPALAATDYGRLLMVKIALVTAMIAIAAVNRLRLSPRLGTGETLRQLHSNTIAEAGLGLIVIVIVAALGLLPPAAHMAMAHGS